MSSHEQQFTELVAYERETVLLRSVASVLNWDERTGLPPKAAEYRADQLSYFAAEIHRRCTDSRYGDWLGELSESELAADPHSDAGTVIRQLKREYDRQRCLPSKLVEELSRQSILGQQAWGKARQQNDYSILKPLLGRIVELKQEEAEAVGYQSDKYDALLDEFEPGERTANVARLLKGLREALVPLVEAIANAKDRPNVDILKRPYDVATQQQVGRKVAERIGFDFDRGRLDVTSHPFCSESGPNDIRILTRYNERFFNESFFGVMHEAGHGIYEQGLRTEWYGLPPGKYVSLGIHESQSRLWENFVGRSKAFWRHFFPEVKAAYRDSLADVDAWEFYRAVNDVRPSLIRVEADEVTYNLHIIIRFELEQALIENEISVDDLPEAWNERYERYLGITPDSDANGVLQDVHWSSTAIGYFSTYSLGNLYAAQMMESAAEELGDLDAMFEEGEFEPLRKWLCERVYRFGQCHSPAELIERISGKALNHEPLVAYLKAKMEPIYGITFA